MHVKIGLASAALDTDGVCVMVLCTLLDFYYLCCKFLQLINWLMIAKCNQLKWSFS